MRDFNEAIGRVISSCSVLKAEYEGWWEGNDHQMAVYHRSHPLYVVGSPNQGAFTLISVHKLSNTDFDLSDGGALVDTDLDIPGWKRDLPISNIQVDVLSQMVESEGLEFFDGIRATTPLFVYDESFGPQEFDRTATSLAEAAGELFNRSINHIGVDAEELTQDTEDGGQESGVGDERAFQ